jgi:hypothetical protein
MTFDIRQMMNSVLERTVFQKPLKRELITIFNEIAPFYVPTGSEHQMVEYATAKLRESGFEVIVDAAQNIEATRRYDYEGTETLVAINAHTDTVQGAADKGITLGGGALYNWIRDEFVSNGDMIGGDDKCGIAVALCLARYTDLPMKIVFTAGEERGGIGMKALRKEAWDGVSFCFTVDRMHGNDIISVYCGGTCAPKEFVNEFIRIAETYAGVKYVDTAGSWADTATISDFVPAVNLSAGYYNPHTSNDLIKCDEMYKTMLAVKAAIEHKSELEAAIASAPANWKRSRVAPVTTTYAYGGGGYGAWGYSGYYDDDYTSVVGGARSRARGATTDAYDIIGKAGRKKIRKGQRTLGGKDYEKCKINVIDDDEEEDEYEMGDMNPDEEEVVMSYVDNEITEPEWDKMLKDGVITRKLYNYGIDLKIESELGTGIGGEDEEDAAIAADLEFDDEQLQEAIDKSGYLPGSIEFQVFTDYLIDAIDYSDLQDYALHGTIGWDLVREATKVKKELTGFDGVNTGVRVIKPADVKQVKHDHESTIGRMMSQSEQEDLLDDFVNGEISEIYWEEYYSFGNISKDTYNEGYIEREAKRKNKRKPTSIAAKTYNLLPVKQVQSFIDRVANGKVTLGRWNEMFDEGRITQKEYERGLEARLKKRQKTLMPMAAFEQECKEHVEKYLAGKYNEYEWDRMHQVGTITEYFYQEGIARKRANETDKIAKENAKQLTKSMFSSEEIYVNKFVDGKITTEEWRKLLDTHAITQKTFSHGWELLNLKQLGIHRVKTEPPQQKPHHPKTLPSDKKQRGNKMSKEDGLELARQFALGAIPGMEWERMNTEREIPLWVYDRGFLERKHYVSYGYFSEDMSKHLAPKNDCCEFGRTTGYSRTLLEQFIDGKITYQGWVVMRATDEIAEDMFLEGITKRELSPALAKTHVANIVERYTKDQTDVR